MGSSLRTVGMMCSMLIATMAVHGQVRVVQWNLAELRGEPPAVAEVIAALDVDDWPGFAREVSILTVQEADTATYTHLLNTLGPEWTAATYTNSGEDNYGGAQACFYHAQTVTEIPSGHDGTYTEAGRRARRWLFSLNGYQDPPVTFYVYSAHLKAGNTSASEADRNIGAGRVLSNMDEVPEGSRIIVTGDMNFYDNDESGYQTFISGGLIDPLGTGSWSSESQAHKHTQSPRTIASGGLASGGMDDRFDFQFINQEMQGTGGLCLIDGSLRAVGNDGDHYNTAINNGSNSYWPNDVSGSNALADALHDASDHLPVAAEYRMPPILEAALTGCDFGVVLEGWVVDPCTLDLSNMLPVGAGIQADLPWSATGSGALSALAESGSIVAGESTSLTLNVDTSLATSGPHEVQILSSDPTAQHAPWSEFVSGQVLRHANPSFDNETDTNFQVFFEEVDSDVGVIPLSLQFWNFGWDADQSRMDIDEVSMPDPPLQFLGGSWSNIGPFAVNLPFELDTNGLASGTYVRSVVITVSDEDLPGEASSSLVATFNITVREPTEPCEGDVTGDGQTSIEDILALLGVWGTSPPEYDLNQDGSVDINDLLLLIADFGCE